MTVQIIKADAVAREIVFCCGQVEVPEHLRAMGGPVADEVEVDPRFNTDGFSDDDDDVATDMHEDHSDSDEQVETTSKGKKKAKKVVSEEKLKRLKEEYERKGDRLTG